MSHENLYIYGIILLFKYVHIMCTHGTFSKRIECTMGVPVTVFSPYIVIITMMSCCPVTINFSLLLVDKIVLVLRTQVHSSTLFHSHICHMPIEKLIRIYVEIGQRSMYKEQKL